VAAPEQESIGLDLYEEYRAAGVSIEASDLDDYEAAGVSVDPEVWEVVRGEGVYEGMPTQEDIYESQVHALKRPDEPQIPEEAHGYQEPLSEGMEEALATPMQEVPAAPATPEDLEGIIDQTPTHQPSYTRPMAQQIIATGARIGGVVTGATTSLVDMALPHPERRKIAEKEWGDVANSIEADLQQRMEKAKGAGFPGFMSNLQSDLSDNVVGIAHLMSEVLALDSAVGWVPDEFGKEAKREFRKGKSFGRLLTPGVTAGTVVSAQNIREMAETRPLSTLLMLYPALKASGATKLIPDGPLKRMREAAAQGVHGTVAVDAAFYHLYPKAKKMGSLHAAWRRYVDDIAAQRDIPAENVVREMMSAGKEYKARVLSEIEEVAMAVERGEMSWSQLHGNNIDVPEVRNELRKRISALADDRPEVQVLALSEMMLDPDIPAELVNYIRENMETGLIGLGDTYASLLASKSAVTAKPTGFTKPKARKPKKKGKTKEERRKRRAKERKRSKKLSAAQKKAAAGRDRKLASIEEEMAKIDEAFEVGQTLLEGDPLAGSRRQSNISFAVQRTTDELHRIDMAHGANDVAALQAMTALYKNLDTPHESVATIQQAMRSRIGRLRSAKARVESDLAGRRAALKAGIEGIDAKMRGRKGVRKARKELKDQYSPVISQLEQDVKTLASAAFDADELVNEDILRLQRSGLAADYPQTTVQKQQTVAGVFNRSTGVAMSEDMAFALDRLNPSSEHFMGETNMNLLISMLPAEVRAGLAKAGRGREVLAQSAARRRVTKDWVLSLEELSRKPEGQALVDMTRDIVRIVSDEMGLAELVRRAQTEKVLGLEKAILSSPGGAKITGAHVLEAITAPLREESIQILRSSAARNSFVRHLLNKTEGGEKVYSGFSRKGLEHHIKQMAESSWMESPLVYEFIDINGNKINLVDELVLWRQSDPKGLAKMKADAVRDLGVQLSAGVERRALERMISNEYTKWSSLEGAQNVDDMARHIARSVFVTGEGRPMILAGHTARDLAEQLTGENAARVAEMVLSDLNIEATPAAMSRYTKAVESLGHDMRTRYRPFDGGGESIYDSLPVQARTLMDQLHQTGRATRGDIKPVGRAVDVEFKQSVGTYLSLLDSMSATNNTLNKLVQQGKMNYTVASVGTWKNIMFANLLTVAQARGGTPVGLMGSVLSVSKKWSDFRAGKPTALVDDVNALDKRAFKSIGQTGKLSTSLVDAEISTLTNRDMSFSLPIRQYQKAEGAATKGYQWLDSSFKLEIGYRNWHRITKDMGLLGVGEYVDLIVNKRVKRVTKTRDGWSMHNLERPVPSGAKPVTQNTVDRLVAHHAMQGGDNLLFDMTSAPLFLAKLRTGGAAGSLMSLFTTWMFKAIDIPLPYGWGKKGLVSGMVQGDYIAPSTNSRRLMQNNLLRGAGMSAKRSLMYHATVADLERRQPEELRKLFRPMQRGAAAMLVQESLNPARRGMVGVRNLQHINWAMPSDLLLRGVMGAAVAMTDHEDLFLPGAGKALIQAERAYFGTPEQRKKAMAEMTKEAKAAGYTRDQIIAMRNRRRILVEANTEKYLSLETVLQLAQMQGNPLVELIIHGSDVNVSSKKMMSLMNSVAMMAVGSTAWRVFDVAAANWNEASMLSTRAYAKRTKDKGEIAPLVEWSVDRILGQAWRVKNLGLKKAETFERIQRSILESFEFGWDEKINRHKNEYADLKSRGENEKAQEEAQVIKSLMEQKAEWAALVNGVVAERFRLLREHTRKVQAD